MKGLWVVVVLLSLAACGVLGYLIVRRQQAGPQALRSSNLAGKDVPENLIAELEKVDPKLIIGREEGRYPTGLKELRGVSAGPEDRIYVVGDKALVTLSSGGAPAGRTELDQPPLCVAADADGTAYVGLRSRVEVVDPKGGRKAWEELGPKAWVTSVAVAPDAVYVGDFGQKQVVKFDKSGKRLGLVGPSKVDEKHEKYVIPSPFFDVAIDGAGKPWVTHTGWRLIENYREDGSFVAAWGKSGPQIESFSGCCNPTHIAIRKDGSLVTTEKGLVRIKIHGPTGALEGVIAAAKDFAKGITGLDVAVDSKDRILVSDPGTSSVRVYVRTP